MAARISMSGATEAARPAAGHAAQMDAVYAVQRHIYDLTRKYYLLGRDRLIAGLDVPKGGLVLEVGCGTARNLALAALRYPEARFCGLDISAEMLKSAEKTLERKGLSGRCSLALGDAADFDAGALFGQRQFDRILFSYTLSMIPPWREALAHACTLLAPGGEIHVVDFGQQEGLPGWFARLLKAWLVRFHVTPRAELFGHCEALAREHGLTCETAAFYRDYARAVVLRRP